MAFGPLRLAALLAALEPAWTSARFCVALSGGLDSTVLLHALASMRSSSRLLRLRAVHVDHGLQPESPAWADQCARFCRSLDMALHVIRLGLAPTAGESVEAEARSARYAAMGAILEPGEWLLTAHHCDDQMETVLIQLLRGAGVAGLAAMPSRAHLGPGWHGRPLLEVGRAELAAYARAEGLSWIVDPMNEEERYDRGWLRRRALPLLLERWPALPATVARTARHLAGAQRLLESLAELDGGGLIDEGRLEIQGLLRLPPDRQANVLRWWVAGEGLPMPSEARLRALREDLIGARIDAMPLVAWGDVEVRRYRGRLYALPRALKGAPASGTITAAAGAHCELPAGLGRIVLDLVPGAGLRVESLGERLELEYRAGGESLRPAPGRPRRALRNLFQEAGVVPWMRPRLPLLYAGGRLVAVADLWLDADFTVTAGEAGLQPRWKGRPRIF
jgi:tRNA(Ile)-lysidine synthase